MRIHCPASGTSPPDSPQGTRPPIHPTPPRAVVYGEVGEWAGWGSRRMSKVCSCWVTRHWGRVGGWGGVSAGGGGGKQYSRVGKPSLCRSAFCFFFAHAPIQVYFDVLKCLRGRVFLGCCHGVWAWCQILRRPHHSSAEAPPYEAPLTCPHPW